MTDNARALTGGLSERFELMLLVCGPHLGQQDPRVGLPPSLQRDGAALYSERQCRGTSLAEVAAMCAEAKSF